MGISYGAQSVHAWGPWETTGRLWGPKRPYTVNVMQVCVFAGHPSGTCSVSGVTSPGCGSVLAPWVVAAPTPQAGQGRAEDILRFGLCAWLEDSAGADGSS